MQSDMLVFIRRCSFVYLFVIFSGAFGQDLAEGSSAASQSRFIAAHDGVPIGYSTFGAGSPALVFVHGYSCDRSYWKEQVAPFSRDFRVVTVDLAGHGESGMERKEWSIESFGGDVSSVVEGLDLQNVVLVGHSMGSPIILEAARRLPGRVSGLVLVDTYGDFGPSWTAEEIEAFLEPFRADFIPNTRAWVRDMFPDNADQALVEQVAKDMSAAPPDVAREVLESAIMFMYGGDTTAVLKNLDVPAFAINSDHGLTDVKSMEHYGIETQIISGVGHFLMMEDPDAFNSALTNVINSLVD